jgi:hypothetical protein
MITGLEVICDYRLEGKEKQEALSLPETPILCFVQLKSLTEKSTKFASVAPSPPWSLSADVIELDIIDLISESYSNLRKLVPNDVKMGAIFVSG